MATQNIFDLSDTWNAGGTTFAGIKLNVTDTASASGSLLIDLLVGGVSKFSVAKTGAVASATTGAVTYLHTLTKTDNTFGPFLKFEHIKTTPGASTLGGIQWFFTDSAAASKAGVGLGAASSNVTVSSEATAMTISTYVAGVFAARAAFGGGLTLNGATDLGVGTINTAGTIKGVLTTSANAVTGLTPGVLAATTNASLVITDGNGQVFRVPCII